MCAGGGFDCLKWQYKSIFMRSLHVLLSLVDGIFFCTSDKD